MILALLYMTLLAQHATPRSIETTSSNNPNNTAKDGHITINHHQADDKRYISSQDIDVNGTVAEVEQILANNPDLPRLSRDEIMEILSNITSEDQTTENTVRDTNKTIQSSREEYMRKMRALMLVLPFNAKNLTESKIKELYTKAPVTRLVSGVPYEEETTTKSIPSPSTKQSIITVTWTEEPSVIKELQSSNHHNVYHEPFNRQPSTSTETTSESSTERQTRPSQNRRRRPPVHPTSTNIPEVHDESSNRPKITQRKPSVQEQRLTTVYPEKTSIYHLDKQQNQDAQQAQTGAILVQQQQNSSYRPLRKRKKTTTPAPTTSVTTKLVSNAVPTNKNSMAIGLPSDMKQLIDNFNIHDHITTTETSESVFVTPSVETIHMVDPRTKQNNLPNSNKFSTSVPPVSESLKNDEIQGILASIGLFPEKYKTNENSTPMQQQNDPITVPTPTLKTTTTVLPDISGAVESLTPEMKDLLVSFGLLPSENDIQPPPLEPDLTAEPSGEAYNPQASPVVDPSSYLSFKPLPLTASANSGREEDNYALSSDMKEFLASFGLVSDSPSMYRSQKSLENKSENVSVTNESNTNSEKTDNLIPQINLEMLSPDMQDVLENIGFISGTHSTKSKRKTSSHIFNPSAHLASLQPTEEEAKRLTKLLDTVKKIVKENATLSQEEIRMLNSSIAFILPPLPEDSVSQNTTVASSYSVPRFIQKKNKITPLDQVESAPDPLSLDELLLNADKQKNEVKRQQSNSETSTSAIETTSSTTESTSTTTTTDAGPSLTDLAESFGGGETASSDTDIDDALPPRRPNGLYFLLDWNTFLDVGVEGERRINLRFTPKLGNPRAFIPVTVP